MCDGLKACVDGAGLNTKRGRPRGRCEKGERPRQGLPQGHWRTTSFVAGLRLSGIDAPMLLDGAIDGDALGAYVRQLPVPALRPGDVVIMDILAVRKRPAARAAIEAAGARLVFLTPSAPDFNPIEFAFSKRKALLRTAAERPKEALWDALAGAIEKTTPQDSANMFAATGYEPE